MIAGKGSPVFSIRHSHASKSEAEKAAKAKLDETARGADKMNLTMPANPLIAAEGQVLLTGFRIGVDGVWSIKSVKHAITSAGFKTSIQAEKPKNDGH